MHALGVFCYQLWKCMQISVGAKSRKRASRRHRRRPRNLLSAYARRKRKNIWLETHIWHAKRFHMTELWGYKIPNYANDRGVRAAYRDATTRCVLMVGRFSVLIFTFKIVFNLSSSVLDSLTFCFGLYRID